MGLVLREGGIGHRVAYAYPDMSTASCSDISALSQSCDRMAV